MKNRLKELRKDLHITQAQLADALHVSKPTIEAYEYGRTEITERSFNDICRIYNVNEEWLKEGTGPMYKPRSENEIIAQFVNDVMESKSDDFKKRLINALSQLDEDEWKVLEELAKKMQ